MVVRRQARVSAKARDATAAVGDSTPPADAAQCTHSASTSDVHVEQTAASDKHGDAGAAIERTSPSTTTNRDDQPMGDDAAVASSRMTASARSAPAQLLDDPTLPAGWQKILHDSGLPCYVHEQLRLVCWSKPYVLDDLLGSSHDLYTLAQQHVPPLSVFKPPHNATNSTASIESHTSSNSNSNSNSKKRKLRNASQNERPAPLRSTATSPSPPPQPPHPPIAPPPSNTPAQEPAPKQLPPPPPMTLEEFKTLATSDPRVLQVCMELSYKTPAQVLQEYQNRNRGIAIHFTTHALDSADASMTRQFKTIVSAGNTVAEGVATTKRVAKQRSAQALLALLHERTVTTYYAVAELYSSNSSSNTNSNSSVKSHAAAAGIKQELPSTTNAAAAAGVTTTNAVDEYLDATAAAVGRSSAAAAAQRPLWREHDDRPRGGGGGGGGGGSSNSNCATFYDPNTSSSSSAGRNYRNDDECERIVEYSQAPSASASAAVAATPPAHRYDYHHHYQQQHPQQHYYGYDYTSGSDAAWGCAAGNNYAPYGPAAYASVPPVAYAPQLPHPPSAPYGSGLLPSPSHGHYEPLLPSPPQTLADRTNNSNSSYRNSNSSNNNSNNRYRRPAPRYQR